MSGKNETIILLSLKGNLVCKQDSSLIHKYPLKFQQQKHKYNKLHVFNKKKVIVRVGMCMPLYMQPEISSLNLHADRGRV